MAVYDELLTKWREVTLTTTIMSIMGWDAEVYIPPKGHNLRGDQMALLSQLRHRMISSPNIGKMLDKLEKKSNYAKLDPIQQRNVHLIRRRYDVTVKIPEELAAAYAKQTILTRNTWKKAKKKRDWKLFEPDLTTLFDLVKKRAEIMQDVRQTPTLYDALIDLFEPKMTQAEISHVFNDLRKALVPLVNRYSEAIRGMDFSFLKRRVSIETQRKISNALAEFILYDVTSDQAGGRIDETEHPFTTGYYDDVRITTHYYETNILSSIYSILHEGGHALYDQNFPLEYKFQPVGDASSYGIHESQSRFIENMIGRSPEFIQYFLPQLNKITDGTFKDISTDQFTKAANKVERSKIRIEADEVTYSLHIIIRFEIERDLFAKKIKLSELPSVWNEKYDKYLGVTIEHDSEGVMQDTHWGQGYFGYFPSYALGNIYGGQFLEKMVKEIPDWLDQVAVGKFSALKQWMVDNVHQYGDLYDPQDLVRKVTGEGLNAKPFIGYLTTKYQRIFNV